MPDKPGDISERVTAFLLKMTEGNKVEPSSIPALVRETAQAFLEIEKMSSGGMAPPALQEEEVSGEEPPAAGKIGSWKGRRSPDNPAVPKDQSVTRDYIVCLEDGKQMKMLKRHLRTHYSMSPEEYREKWGLPDNYPMTAPAYALERQMIARKSGFGKDTAEPRKKKAK